MRKIAIGLILVFFLITDTSFAQSVGKSKTKAVKSAVKSSAKHTKKHTSKKIAKAIKKNKQPRKIRLYLASALFNARETRFNLEIAQQLESHGFQSILPQRDGFEYISTRKLMKKYLPKSDVLKTTRDLIYLLDMGVLIPQSDVIVANLDEPLDEGVIVEITYAHMIGKPVIGYRTDSRTPYGGSEGLGGMHAFVAFQCDYLIKMPISGASMKDSSAAVKRLAAKIDKIIRKISLPAKTGLPSYAIANPVVANMLKASGMVFAGVHGIHTKEGMAKTLRRMALHRQKISDLVVNLQVNA